MTMFYVILALRILYSLSMLYSSMVGLQTGTVQSNDTAPGNLILLSTFRSISVKAPFSGDTNGNNSAEIQFRPVGSTAWLKAYTPFIDRRQKLDGVQNPYFGQARVSIVGLTENTKYEVQVIWTDTDGVTSQPSVASVSTLSYEKPTGGSTITVRDDATLSAALRSVQPGQTIHMNPGSYRPFAIRRSGSEGAWIVLEGETGGGTVVTGAGEKQNVLVSANYVVIRNLRLSASDSHGMFLSPKAHHIFAQDNSFENISTTCGANPKGHYDDGGITIGDGAGDIVILRNNINSSALSASACTLKPNYDSPGAGIQWYNITTLVVQDNTVTGGFRDAITVDNSGDLAENVDVVGNSVAGYKDDGLESKGGNVNVRIWGNHVTADQANTCLAANTNTTSNRYGPIYIFRNDCLATARNSEGTTVFKLGGSPMYLFHNSVDASRATPRWDGLISPDGFTVAMNNIVKLGGSAIDYGTRGAVLDYNLYFINSDASFAYKWDGAATYNTLAEFKSRVGQEQHGKNQEPRFADTQLHINATSPAFDTGTVIMNFNDPQSAWPYSGAAPDIGAFEFRRN